MKVGIEEIVLLEEKYRGFVRDDIDPRSNINLDTTKIAFHQERLKAYLDGKRIAPITIDMALTQKCSLKCVYCYANLQQRPNSPASWETYKNLIDDFVEIGHKPGEGVKAVSLVSDGESTENPYFYDFINYAHSKEIDTAVGTNGLKLDVNKLPEILNCLTYFRVNISAGEREAYAKIHRTKPKVFDKVLENIKECVKIKKNKGLKTTIGLQMVLLPEYSDQVIPLALLGRNLGVDYTVIKHCSDDEKGSLGIDYGWYRTPEAQRLLKLAESFSTEDYVVQAKWSKIKTGRDRVYTKCFGPPFILQMSGSGLVAPCGCFFNERYRAYHIGDYTKQRFKDIWNSERYWEVMKLISSEKFDARRDCASLCLQDKVNEFLFDVIERGNPIPDVSRSPLPKHINFI